MSLLQIPLRAVAERGYLRDESVIIDDDPDQVLTFNDAVDIRPVERILHDQNLYRTQRG